MKNIALILAGGTGSRFSSYEPKQFYQLKDKPLIVHTLNIFYNNPLIDSIYIACLKEYIEPLKKIIKMYNINKNINILEGGATGLESTYKGIKEIAKKENINSYIIIHDANRPFIKNDNIEKLLLSCKKNGNGVTSLKTTELIMYSEDGKSSNKCLGRDSLYSIQKPECYRLRELIETYNYAFENNITNFVATCDLFIKLNKKIYLVEGNIDNIKITYKKDLIKANKILEKRKQL